MFFLTSDANTRTHKLFFFHMTLPYSRGNNPKNKTFRLFWSGGTKNVNLIIGSRNNPKLTPALMRRQPISEKHIHVTSRNGQATAPRTSH